ADGLHDRQRIDAVETLVVDDPRGLVGARPASEDRAVDESAELAHPRINGARPESRVREAAEHGAGHADPGGAGAQLTAIESTDVGSLPEPARPIPSLRCSSTSSPSSCSAGSSWSSAC